MLVMNPAELDRADPLARFRAEFHLPPGLIYLDSNSLGLLSRPAEASLLRALNQWRELGIGGWTEANPPWLTLAEATAKKLAPLLGAAPEQICLAGQTTANLHQLLATIFAPSEPVICRLVDTHGLFVLVSGCEAQLISENRLPPISNDARIRCFDFIRRTLTHIGTRCGKRQFGS